MNKKIFDLNKLYIVTDFDHTLTTKNSQNCWGVLSTIPNISKDYITQSIKNNPVLFSFVPLSYSDMSYVLSSVRYEGGSVNKKLLFF